MKSVYSFVLSIFLANTVFSQAATDMWPQLDAFHTAIALTFHPAEDGDFEPIRTGSGELASMAGALATEDAPKEFHTPEIRTQTDLLNRKCMAIDELVKSGNASDSDLMASLQDIHSVYHGIEELCREKMKEE